MTELPTKNPPVLIRCNGCSTTWTGAMACHCASCHRTFTGVTAFDLHRTGGRCNDPETLVTKLGEPRLVRVTKRYWSGWGRPGEGWSPE
jgi:hypothetical protein